MYVLNTDFDSGFSSLGAGKGSSTGDAGCSTGNTCCSRGDSGSWTRSMGISGRCCGSESKEINGTSYKWLVKNIRDKITIVRMQGIAIMEDL